MALWLGTQTLNEMQAAGLHHLLFAACDNNSPYKINGTWYTFFSINFTIRQFYIIVSTKSIFNTYNACMMCYDDNAYIIVYTLYLYS